MTPERRRRFEAEWPALSRRVRRMLASKGVPRALHDDIVQETGLRLYGSWERVLEGASVWPFVKTIALNLLRDRARRPTPEPVEQLPERRAQHDVEEASMARLELARVQKALGGLTAGQREALLAEVGVGKAGRGSAQKMMRSRARQKLTVILERMPLLAPFRSMSTDASWIAGARDLVMNGAACFACMVLGVGSLTFLPPPSADVVPLDTPGPLVEATEMSSRSVGTQGTLDALSAGVLVPDLDPDQVEVSSDDGRRQTKGAGSKQAAAPDTGSGAGPLSPPSDLPIPNARAPEAGTPSLQEDPVLNPDDGKESPVAPPTDGPEHVPSDLLEPVLEVAL